MSEYRGKKRNYCSFWVAIKSMGYFSNSLIPVKISCQGELQVSDYVVNQNYTLAISIYSLPIPGKRCNTTNTVYELTLEEK